MVTLVVIIIAGVSSDGTQICLSSKGVGPRTKKTNGTMIVVCL